MLISDRQAYRTLAGNSHLPVVFTIRALGAHRLSSVPDPSRKHMMLALTLGLLLLAGGAAGRFPLVGVRVNSSVAFVGAVLSLVGLGRLVRKQRVDHDEATTDVHAEKPARAA